MVTCTAKNTVISRNFHTRKLGEITIIYEVLYNDNNIKPLHLMLPKTSAYVKRYDGQTKWMYFLIEDDELLEKCNAIWDKVSADIKKELDSEPVYNKNFFKTKIKSHGDKITGFLR